MRDDMNAEERIERVRQLWVQFQYELSTFQNEGHGEPDARAEQIDELLGLTEDNHVRYAERQQKENASA
jgi:hypothetical protein